MRESYRGRTCTLQYTTRYAKSYFPTQTNVSHTFLPARCKTDHKREKFGRKVVCAARAHAFVCHTLEFFEVSAFVAELSVFKTKAAVCVGLSDTWIFGKRHHAALTHFVFHAPILQHKNSRELSQSGQRVFAFAYTLVNCEFT